MIVMSSQFLELNMSPVEIRAGSYSPDNKMVEREAGLTRSSNAEAWNTKLYLHLLIIVYGTELN
jgi:hypothetical protein